MGVFVQLNEDSTNPMSRDNPIGYVIQESGCWDWVGSVSSGTRGMRYGHLWVNGKHKRATRHLYELHKGAIPFGFHLDHLCRNTLCVNPDHLEPVTNTENVLRGNGAPAQNRRKTHCHRGHEFVVEGNRRRCLECRRTPEFRAKRAAQQKERYRKNAEHIKAMARARYRRQRGGE